MNLVRAPLDFVGINFYTRTIVAAGEDDELGFAARAVGLAGGNDGPRTDFGWEVWPQGLYDVIMRVTRDYDHPAIEITESGCSYADGPDESGVVNDARRIDYLRGHLTAVHRAIADGADVRGYHAWSLLDNFEWAEGYHQRFGLVWVDFASGRRIPKESSRWYARVAAENALDDSR